MRTISLPESKLRRSVDSRMAGSWLFTWHEDREISPGVPDLHYVMKPTGEIGDIGTEYRVGWLELKAIDTNGGSVLEETLISQPAWDGVAIAGGRLYVATQSGDLVCLGARDP